MADKVVELGYCEHLSQDWAGKILKKNELQPHLKRTWCIARVDAAFVSKMARCCGFTPCPMTSASRWSSFDERPCFLIGDEIDPIPLQSGQVKKEHYTYAKNGSCALLAALEPLSGKRLAEVYEHRGKREYTLFLKELAAAYPKAEKIRLVPDNLSTHNASSFYEQFPAEEAFRLAQRFEFYYTPKSSSWLNRIEIEFSALVKQCLDRRIPTWEQLTREVLAIAGERRDKEIRIHWQFSIEKARTKMNTAYVGVNSLNQEYKQT